MAYSRKDILQVTGTTFEPAPGITAPGVSTGPGGTLPPSILGTGAATVGTYLSGAGAWIPLGHSASYTPTWTASSSNPSLGNGTLVGVYSQVGNIVVASFHLTAGSTTTFGSGSYTFSVPVAAETTVGGGDVYGGGIMYLSGGVSINLLRWRADGELVINQSAFSVVGSGSLAFASGSVIQGNLVYLAA